MLARDMRVKEFIWAIVVGQGIYLGHSGGDDVAGWSEF
jgi:hypothetical protein